MPLHEVTQRRKHKRGFAVLSPERQREIASMGGRRAHEMGLAHEWTAEEARAAGQKGGARPKGAKRQ